MFYFSQCTTLTILRIWILSGCVHKLCIGEEPQNRKNRKIAGDFLLRESLDEIVESPRTLRTVVEEHNRKTRKIRDF